MGRVNRESLHLTLEGLQGAGVLAGWVAKPRGMYRLVLPDGSVLTPDTKETAMWAMGASAGVHFAVQAPGAGGVDATEHAELAQLAQASLALESYSVDDEGDFIVTLPGQTGFLVAASDFRSWLEGAEAATGVLKDRERSRTSQYLEPKRKKQLEDRLDALTEVLLRSWSIDEDGSYRLDFNNFDDPAVLHPSELDTFVLAASLTRDATRGKLSHTEPTDETLNSLVGVVYRSWASTTDDYVLELMDGEWEWVPRPLMSSWVQGALVAAVALADASPMPPEATQ